MSIKYDKIKNIRKQVATQLAFSEMIDISADHYIKIENGYNKPSVPVFLRICKTLNMPAQYFFTSQSRYLENSQIEDLMNRDTAELETILHILQSIYEGTKAKK